MHEWARLVDSVSKNRARVQLEKSGDPFKKTGTGTGPLPDGLSGVQGGFYKN
jgi:hypothetical protein